MSAVTLVNDVCLEPTDRSLRISQCSPALKNYPATSLSPRHKLQEKQAQDGVLATMLPVDVLLGVFKLLDLRSLGRAACGDLY